MARLIIAFYFLMAINIEVNAQYNHIIKKGGIEYEFKVNRYERAKKLLGPDAASSNYREQILWLQNNRFFTRNYEMEFNNGHTSFQLQERAGSQDFIDLLIGIPTTQVRHDLTSDSIFMRKQFGEESFLIAENTPKIKWKHTDERMEIAGYECRRANGLFMDSVYIVAFYCPEIDVSGGPAVISGLPGMILGVSIPQEHINIFATKVDPNYDIGRADISLGKKSKRKNFTQFEEYLRSVLGDRFSADKWEMTKRSLMF